MREWFHQQKDTTLWTGMGTLIALGLKSDLLKQSLVAILAPSISWILLFYVKKLMSWLHGNKEEDNNK